MRFPIAKNALAVLVGLVALTALDTSSANAGIIITIGDSPLLTSTQIQRYMAFRRHERDESAQDESHEEGEFEEFEGREPRRDQASAPTYQAGYRTCQSTQTGKTELCPRPASPEVDQSGLPSEWSCYAIRPGVFYCDGAMFGAGADAGQGGYAGEGDFGDDELTVMGCGGGASSSASWMLALLGIGGLAWSRRKRSLS